MRELRTLGSVRGVLSNGYLYRDWTSHSPCPWSGRKSQLRLRLLLAVDVLHVWSSH